MTFVSLIIVMTVYIQEHFVSIYFLQIKIIIWNAKSIKTSVNSTEKERF